MTNTAPIENLVKCKQVQGNNFECDTSNMSIDIDLGLGTWLALVLILVLK